MLLQHVQRLPGPDIWQDCSGLGALPGRAGKVHGMQGQNLRVALLLEPLQPCVYVLPALIQHLQVGACSVLMLMHCINLLRY